MVLGGNQCGLLVKVLFSSGGFELLTILSVEGEVNRDSLALFIVVCVGIIELRITGDQRRRIERRRKRGKSHSKWLLVEAQD